MNKYPKHHKNPDGIIQWAIHSSLNDNNTFLDDKVEHQSVSTMMFKTIITPLKLGLVEDTTYFTRILNGHTYKGTTMLGDHPVTNEAFDICNNKWHRESDGLMHLGCYLSKPTELSTNHMEFKDQHGGTIHMMRQGSDMSNMNMN
jgi:hypothetical protein